MSPRVIVTPSQQYALLRYLVHTATTCVYVESQEPGKLHTGALVDRVVEAHRNSQLHIHDPFVCMLVAPDHAALDLHLLRRRLHASLMQRDVPLAFIRERVLTGTVPTTPASLLIIADGGRALMDYRVIAGESVAQLQQMRWRALFRADNTWVFTPNDAASNLRQAPGEGLTPWMEYVPAWLLQLVV